jgi:DNA-binding IscR family transcriptional regulator
MTGDAHDLVEAGLWLSVSEIARQKDKSRQAIAKRVDSLVEAGLIETRAGPGGTKLVNLAQYDRAVGEVGDAFKEAAAETRAAEAGAGGAAGVDPTTARKRDHQARSEQYTADLKFLDLEERLKRLVPIEEAKDGGVKIGEAVVSIMSRLPTYAEAMTAVAVKDGVQGARGLFKDIERELRAEIAKALAKIAGDASPSSVEPGEDNAPA